ncbi:MAG: PhoPQ-activated pathogenicity-related family protein [Gammaproteobacteria bacterium]
MPVFSRPVLRHLPECLLAVVLSLTTATVVAGALEDYVNRPDSHFSWKRLKQEKAQWGTLTRLVLVSQRWREYRWHHRLIVARPRNVRNPGMALVWVTGDGDGGKHITRLKTLAQRASAVTAVLTQIPNQPLYQGRREDALIAYTFDQFLKSGDETWPLLFPMAKSVVRAMDAVQALARSEFKQAIARFVVVGASKRGWATWLTAAVDPRVIAIAPMVIDMLNIKQQLRWSEKVYGKQSDEIDDYTKLHLDKKQDDPAVMKLRGWVDPYAYRARYTMPKLLLLGTNDPYWTVDSSRHYWDDLPGPKLIFQTPNAGHDLRGGREATQTLAAFFQMLADGQELPRIDWKFQDGADGSARARMCVDQPARAIRLWSATSADRDFRNDAWSSRELGITPGSSCTTAEIATPKTGYRAYLIEVELTSPTGDVYRLSTEARVTPDNITWRPPASQTGGMRLVR